MTEIDPNEVLSALLDREPVDADALAALLEDRESRAMLVDFVRLRSALHADTDSAPAVVPISRRRSWTWRSAVIRVAAAVLLVTAGGLVGTWVASRVPEGPPEPSRVVRLVPAGAEGGAR